MEPEPEPERSPAPSPSSSSSESGSPPSDSIQGRRATITQLEQMKVEERVFELYEVLNGVSPRVQSLMMELWRDNHIEYLTRGIRQLGPNFHVLDANRPWLCYWILHSLALLGEHEDSKMADAIVNFLSRCHDRCGGYGGGPGQLPHLATTYAAINSLVTLGNETALASIDRDKIYDFLLRMKDPSGAFRMHDAGEMDVRAVYTAISVASMLNILDNKLTKDVGNYIFRCQTYEGGIAGEPSSEAHGGYTFCGLATMILINEVDKLDLPRLLDWVIFRQGVECGFQGRTNKLVDGCYSFWQGGVLALLQKLLSIVNDQLKASKMVEGQPSKFLDKRDYLEDDLCSMVGTSLHVDYEGTEKLLDTGFAFLKRKAEAGPLYQSNALQQYILICCQVLDGGLRDKPGKTRDHYHSCYCLSGLSASQYSWYQEDPDDPPLPRAVMGPYSNLLEPIHPIYNVVLDRYQMAREYFSGS